MAQVFNICFKLDYESVVGFFLHRWSSSVKTYCRLTDGSLYTSRGLITGGEAVNLTTTIACLGESSRLT